MGTLTDKIHSSRFDISKKGYDKEQVDEFLDSVITDLERVEKEFAEQKEEIAKFREMQDGMARAMVSVQNAADALLDEAKIKAEVSRREAEEFAERTRREAESYRDQVVTKAQQDAENILREKQAEYSGLAEEIAALREFVEKFREAIRSDIESFTAALEQPQAAKQALEDCPIDLDAPQEPEEPAEDEERPLYVEDVMKQIEGEEAAAAEDAAEEESDSEQASEEEQKDKPEDPLFDLGDIMKNLPETDSELKAMIDEML